MNFRTRIDFTDRQAKQYEKTGISLSGASTFGLPYSALTTGPDLTMSAITFENAVLQSTYSGNTGTTVYTFGDSRMSIDEGDLTTLTPSNSGTTQYAGPTWIGYNMFTTVDGYTGWTSYSAVTYDLDVVTMVDLGGGAYSGVVQSDFIVYSATSVDWTGNTIWVDVSGTTRTQELIISKNPQIGYVLTCYDSNGKGVWDSVSGITSGVTFWLEDGAGNTALKDDKGGHAISGSSNNAIIAGGLSGIISDSVNSFIGGGKQNGIYGGSGNGIIGGSGNTITSGASNTIILGGTNITANTSDMVYFLSGKTDMIYGYSRGSSYIDMANDANNAIKISYTDIFSGERYLNFDESSSIVLQRASNNYLQLGNGIAYLKSTGTSNFGSTNQNYYSKESHGNFVLGKSGGPNVFGIRNNPSSGSVDGNDLHNGALQYDISFGIPEAGTFDYDGVMGSGLGNASTGTTGYEYYPIFISSPRSQARDNTSFNSIYNSVFVGGSDHIMYTGVTNSVILGGSGHSITSGITGSIIIGGTNITADTNNTVYIPNLHLKGRSYCDPIVGYSLTSQTIDWSLSNNFEFTLSADTTFTFSNDLNGQTIVVAVNQSLSSGYTVTWPSGTTYWVGGTAPTMTSTTGVTDVYTFIEVNNKIYGNYVQNFS